MLSVQGRECVVAETRTILGKRQLYVTSNNNCSVVMATAVEIYELII